MHAFDGSQLQNTSIKSGGLSSYFSSTMTLVDVFLAQAVFLFHMRASVISEQRLYGDGFVNHIPSYIGRQENPPPIYFNTLTLISLLFIATLLISIIPLSFFPSILPTRSCI